MFHPVAKKLDLNLSPATAEGIADVPRTFHRHAIELNDDVSGLKLKVLGKASKARRDARAFTVANRCPVALSVVYRAATMVTPASRVLRFRRLYLDPSGFAFLTFKFL